jgi:hypothetical protein
VDIYALRIAFCIVHTLLFNWVFVFPGGRSFLVFLILQRGELAMARINLGGIVAVDYWYTEKAYAVNNFAALGFLQSPVKLKR